MGRRTFLEAAVAFVGAAASRTGFSAERSVLRVRNYQDLASLDPAFSLGAFDEVVTATIYSQWMVRACEERTSELLMLRVYPRVEDV